MERTCTRCASWKGEGSNSGLGLRFLVLDTEPYARSLLEVGYKAYKYEVMVY